MRYPRYLLAVDDKKEFIAGKYQVMPSWHDDFSGFLVKDAGKDTVVGKGMDLGEIKENGKRKQRKTAETRKRERKRGQTPFLTTFLTKDCSQNSLIIHF